MTNWTEQQDERKQKKITRDGNGRIEAREEDDREIEKGFDVERIIGETGSYLGEEGEHY